MKKIYLTIASFTLIFCSSCTEKDTTFQITENSVGPLRRDTPVSRLEDMFSADSILKDTLSTKIGASTKKIQIFEKGGRPLLRLTPNTDSIQTFENVQILDSRYTSEKGISLNSTFKDIQENYAIKKIVTTFNSIVVFPKESNLYFTIDKSELPSSLRYTTTKIEAVQIPDEAKIKYLMLGWD
ncbi:hypothetical protein MTsPCn5_29090 [Croceitalea sp. MTPC5]|uniref:hypothetical protein n=1 Tax=Croceitalea sp. MTPC5 TaxID=3056565 RepID=UPI002B3ABD25|nr:hypothetical protein MTsPCn5_29090 [Croceitalea sp. MTPC5]